MHTDEGAAPADGAGIRQDIPLQRPRCAAPQLPQGPGSDAAFVLVWEFPTEKTESFCVTLGLPQAPHKTSVWLLYTSFSN